MNLHTLDAVAKALQVSVDTVAAWVRRGELRAVNVSRDRASRKPRWRVRETDLEGFLSGREVAPDSPRQMLRTTRKRGRQWV